MFHLTCVDTVTLDGEDHFENSVRVMEMFRIVIRDNIILDCPIIFGDKERISRSFHEKESNAFLSR